MFRGFKVQNIAACRDGLKNSRNKSATSPFASGKSATSAISHGEVGDVANKSTGIKKVKERIAVNGFPSHSYGTSLAIWNHTCYLLPDTSERAPP